MELNNNQSIYFIDCEHRRLCVLEIHHRAQRQETSPSYQLHNEWLTDASLGGCFRASFREQSRYTEETIIWETNCSIELSKLKSTMNLTSRKMWSAE